MRGLKAILWACALVVALPWAAFAQAGASITGTVRDSSGAVLPGVTVEAASPVLIQKVRTGVNPVCQILCAVRPSGTRLEGP